MFIINLIIALIITIFIIPPFTAKILNKEVKKDELENIHNYEEPHKKIIKTSYFECKATTMENPDGSDRQEIIKRITNNYKKTELDRTDLFGGMTNKELINSYEGMVNEFDGISFDGTYQEYSYKNKPAFLILMEDIDEKSYPVANISKDDIAEFKNIIDNYDVINTEIYIKGGTYKKVSYDNEIYTTNLTYGITFKINYKERIEKD